QHRPGRRRRQRLTVGALHPYQEHSLQQRETPDTPVSLTELGFGASAIGKLYRVTPPGELSGGVRG
ncbi:hypothetical protein ACFY16_42985, partial [Streptomyces sp. NPDC001315]